MARRLKRSLADFTNATATTRNLRRDLWVVYGVPIVCVAAIVMSWAGLDVSIGGGDVSPFVRDGSWSERGSFWNHKNTGAGGTAVTAASTIEAVWVQIVSVFGGGIAVAQRLFFVVEAAICVGGGVHAARLVCSHRVAIIAGGLLAFFNPFVLLHLPNFLFPLSIGVLGFLLGEVARRIEGNGSVVRLVVASLPLMYLSTNPPLLVVIAGSVMVAVVVLFWTSANVSAVTFLNVFLRSGAALLAVHLWWVVPSVVVNVGGSEGSDFAAETNVDNWRWVYQQSFLPQVVSLTAHWGWGQHDIFPWGETLDRWGWSSFRYITPALALCGVASVYASSRRRQVRFGLLVLCVVIVIVWSQGLQEPFGFINRFMFDHVPAWWLFRDPISKFGPCLVLLYVMLTTAGIQWLSTLKPSIRGLSVRPVFKTVLFGVTALMLLFPLPMYSGEVLSGNGRGLAPSKVSIPSGWSTISETVSESANPGKVLVVPLNKSYRVATTWGYDGVDLAPQFFDRPVLQVLPGGYYSERAGYARLLGRVEQAMLDGDVDAVERGAAALGVSHIVVRRDVDPGTLKVRYADADQLFDTARRIPGADIVYDGEVAAAVELSAADGVVRWFGDGLGLEGSPTADQVVAVSAPIVSTSHASGEVWDMASLDESRTFPVVQSRGPYQLKLDAFSSVAARLEKTVSQGALGISVVPELNIDVSGRPASFSPVSHIPIDSVDADDSLGYRVEIDGEAYTVGDLVSVRPGDVVEVWQENQSASRGRYLLGSALVASETSAAIDLPTGTHTISAELPHEQNRVQTFSPVQQCNAIDGRTPTEAGIRMLSFADGFELAAKANSACVIADLDLVEGERFELSFEHRNLTDGVTRFCVWSDTKQQCLASSELATSKTWRSDGSTFMVDDQSEDGRLYFYSDGEDDGSETVGQFRQIEVQKHRSSVVSIEPKHPVGLLPIEVDTTGPASWDIELSGGSGFVTLAESFSDNWELGDVPEGWTVEPVMVDGWAQGWKVDGDGDAVISIRHSTSRYMRWTLWVSLLAFGGLVFWGVFRRSLRYLPVA